MMEIDTPTKVEVIPLLNNPAMIHVGYNLIHDYMAQDIIKSMRNMSNFIVVTDINLSPVLEQFKASMQPYLTSQKLLVRILPPGEAKSRENKAMIEDFMLCNSCTKDTCMIALGGGVIGDLVGFVASTFMRGVPFVQIPTTLLAMVESSVGGKNGVDTAYNKNSIGTFWQPKKIYVDLLFLKTLSKRDISNGLAEVIKMAAISNDSLFEKLELEKEKIELALSSIAHRDFLVSIICTSIKAQAAIGDEFSFGETIGQVFESILAPQWINGECLSVGLVLEAKLSHNLGYCSPEAVNRLANCLKQYDLPTVFDKSTREKITWRKIMNAFNKKNKKRFILMADIGKPHQHKATIVEDHSLEAVLEDYVSKHSSKRTPGIKQVKQQIHPLMTSPALKLVSTTLKLDDLVYGLFNILKNKYQCTLLTSKDLTNTIDRTEEGQDVTDIYFTDEAGPNATTLTSTCHANWYEYIVLNNDYHFFNGAMLFITDVVCGQDKLRHSRPRDIKPTHVMSLAVSDYSIVSPTVLNQWLEGAYAAEFRVDLLDVTSEKWITTAGTQLAHLRQKTKMPIVYIVRTTPQGGQFNRLLSTLYVDLIKWGHRWGCDYVDVEISTLSLMTLDDIMRLNHLYPTTTIIASFHDPSHLYHWSSKTMKNVYDKAYYLFRKHQHDGVIKMVGCAESFADNIELEQFRLKVDSKQKRGVTLVNTGCFGTLSSVVNKFMTPVTHPTILPFTGQVSIAQLSNLRHQLDL